MSQPLLFFPCSVQRLSDGNTLITDAGNELGEGSKIIEINSSGDTVWSYEENLFFAHSAERLTNGNTLITDTGNNRLLLVSYTGCLEFDSSDWNNSSGRMSDGSRFNYPNDAHEINPGNYLVTDRNNDRALIVNKDGKISRIIFHDLIKQPHNADLLSNGNILIASSALNEVIELNTNGDVIWRYGSSKLTPLSFPRDADRINDGLTLVTDSRNHRVLTVDKTGATKWEYKVSYYASFYEADYLDNGHVLISDQHHHQVLEVDKTGEIIWQFQNYNQIVKTLPCLQNGEFSLRDNNGIPIGWHLYLRFSEGTGNFLISNEGFPGLENRGEGAVFLAQRIAVEPGRKYCLTGDLCAEKLSLSASAYLQLYFLDNQGGAITSGFNAPKGRILKSPSSWFPDKFVANSPSNSSTVEVRLFLGGGPGTVFMRNLQLNIV